MLLTWGPHMVCDGVPIYILYLYDQMWLVGMVKLFMGVSSAEQDTAEQYSKTVKKKTRKLLPGTVNDSNCSYPSICRLLRHAQGEALVEF